MSETQTDPAFVTFENMSYGVRALGKLLQAYQSRYGLKTIAQIINRWAPPNENNTQAYIKAVAQFFEPFGNPNYSVNMFKGIDLKDMVSGIICHENGFAFIPACIALSVDQGITLALHG